MTLGAFGTGGASISGPSKLYERLVPYYGYKSITGDPALDGWTEEFLTALGGPFDILELLFCAAEARANFLDPTYTPPYSASEQIATATEAPTGASIADTMLDVLLFIAGIPTPVDTNLTVEMKQGLAQKGWGALERKGARRKILALASQLSGGVVLGWTVPPYEFSVIFPDGAPSPGWGLWCPNSTTSGAGVRPWIFNAYRQVVKKIFPAHVVQGVGYSQFRAGYSEAGDPVLPSGATLNLLENEHFANWTAGTPDSWTKTGSVTQRSFSSTTTAAENQVNPEFTGSCARLDLSGALSGTVAGLSQTVQVNNQLTHRVELDYAYYNAQEVSTLGIQILDVNPNGTTYYYHPTDGTWSSGAYTYYVTPSVTTSPQVRARFATDVTFQASSASTSVQGSRRCTVNVSATADGTSASVYYYLYRVGLYEKFDEDIDAEAEGERTLWLPLVDARGLTSYTTTAGSAESLIEPANADRSVYKLRTRGTGEGDLYPYHPALTGRGFLAHTNWTNLVKGSHNFNTDWTLSNCARNGSLVISPIAGETVGTATELDASATAPYIQQASLVSNPAGRVYVGGVWCKNLGGSYTDVTLGLYSGATLISSVSHTLTAAQGWQLLPIPVTTTTGAHTSDLRFRVSFAAAIANGKIGLAHAYVYDVTTTPSLLYPPVVQSGVGLQGSTGAAYVTANTYSGTVEHPRYRRRMISLKQGALSMRVVPVGGAVVLGTTLFDCRQNATTNRLVLSVPADSELRATLYDGSGTPRTSYVSLTMVESTAPGAGEVQWMRDTEILIRIRWSASGAISMSAGGSHATAAAPGTWTTIDETTPTSITIGADGSGANNFDGIISNLQGIYLG